ncbi:MAG: hypothetical protein JXQ96_06545 [Cyclobacteriaceae bacterium]
MKRAIILIFVLIASIQTSYGQGATDQGVTWFGGTAGFASFSSENASSTTINLSPTVNYFFRNNMFFGGAMDWRRQSEGGSSVMTLGVGPQLGITLNSPDDTSIPYLAVGFRYISNGFDNTNGGTSVRGTDIFAGGGFNVTLAQSVGIIIEIGYHIQSFEGGTSLNALMMGIGVTGILN